MSAISSLPVAYDPEAHGAVCKRCPMKGRTVVPPQAPTMKLKLIVVGEGPGRYEERVGIPFYGPSGKMLNAALLEAGGHRSNCHVTNVTLCRPEDDRELEAAVACCAPRLVAEIAALNKDIPILSLGAQASRVTIGKSGIQKYRGFVWHAPEIKPTQVRNAERQVERIKKTKIWKQKRISKKHALRKAEDVLLLLQARQVIQGRVVIPTVHPAFILRGADVYVPVLRTDVKRALRWPFKLEDDGEYTQTSNAKEAARLLSRLGPIVNVDIETDSADPMRAKLTCVGVCDVEKTGDKKSVVILDPWKKSLAAPLRRALKSRTCVTHNGPAFDVIALLERYNIKFKRNEDTLVAHRSFAGHMPQSLAHVASIYTNTSPWKLKFKSTEEKGAVAGFGVKKEDLAKYNRADIVLGSLCWLRMQRDLDRERAVYKEDMQMAALYTSMQRAGLRVDVARQAQLSRKLRFRAAALVGEMRQLLDRRGFSPSKPNDVRKAIYGQLKAPLWLAPPTPTGLPSTAAVVLEELAKNPHLRAGKLADMIIRWRSANDSRSEYLDGVYVHKDGRVHPSWGQVETGRPRTRNPNILNIPTMDYCEGCGVLLLDGVVHKETCKKRQEPQPEAQLRDIYVAAKGCKFVYFDLQRAEMNFAAYISGDQTFIEGCKKDIHTENACILFPDGAEMIRADPKGKGFKFRQIAKICGFAVCYLAEVNKIFQTLLAAGFDVDLSDCETMLDNLRTAYRVYYRYVAENVALCQKQGYIRIPFSNRIRWFGFFPKPNSVANTPIQGGVAGVMNKRLLELEKRKTKNARLLVYHYDAAIYEVPNGEVADMERIVKDAWMEPIVAPHNGLSWVQKIDQKVGERLSDF
jgi:uracil-DNA glycosylase family 4